MNTNVRPLHANRDVSREFPRNQDSGPHDATKKFEAKGHDRQLQEAQYAGRAISIDTIGGSTFSGVLFRRDRYTVTLRHDDGSERMYFKHAIESIEVKAPVTGLPQIEDGKAAGETGV